MPAFSSRVACLAVLSVLSACILIHNSPDAATAATEASSSGTSTTSCATGQCSTESSMSMSLSDGTTTDATTSSTTATTTTTTTTIPPPNCGDGVVDMDEQCDDGNLTDTDACLSTCQDASCGDGFVQAGVEKCDDGDTEDTDACTSICELATCGDGIVRAGVEQCDNGPANDDSAYGDGSCTTQCAFGQRCGDNIQNGPEECDDGDQTDEDTCSNTCIAPRIVFVTQSNTFTGNLGGLTGADAKCKAAADPLATMAPKEVEWRAWLSDDTGSPSVRLDTSFSGYYQRVDGTAIAHGWADLTDGTLLAPLNVTELGTPLNPMDVGIDVWSNTAPDGSAVVNGVHCNNWTFALNGSKKGRNGLASTIGPDWTDNADPNLNPTVCTAAFRLYCFQHTLTPP